MSAFGPPDMDRDLPKIPPLDPDLIKALDQRFPHRCPDPKDSEREIWMKAGERRLVDFLIAVFNDQTPEVNMDRLLGR